MQRSVGLFTWNICFTVASKSMLSHASSFQLEKITIFKHYLIFSFIFEGDNPPTWNFCSNDHPSMCSAVTDCNTTLFAKTWIRTFTLCPEGPLLFCFFVYLFIGSCFLKQFWTIEYWHHCLPELKVWYSMP